MMRARYPFTLTTLFIFLLIVQPGCKPGDSGDSLEPDSTANAKDSIPEAEVKRTWTGEDIQLQKS